MELVRQIHNSTIDFHIQKFWMLFRCYFENKARKFVKIEVLGARY